MAFSIDAATSSTAASTIRASEPQVDAGPIEALASVTCQDVDINGMALKQWTFLTASANVAIGIDYEDAAIRFATVYSMRVLHSGHGHATALLAVLKHHYERNDYRFAGTVALNGAMKHIYAKLGIHEYCGNESADAEFHSAWAASRSMISSHSHSSHGLHALHSESPRLLSSTAMLGGLNEDMKQDKATFIEKPSSEIRNVESALLYTI